MKTREIIEPPGRVAVLDAAEALFANLGYDGASLREITKRAGVELGLPGYHFRNKDELFRQVLRRRAPDMARALGSALDAALAASHGRRGKVRAILHAYVEPHLERLHSADAGWSSYIRLAAFSALFMNRPELTSAAAEIYLPVMARFRSELANALPGVDETLLDRYYYVFRMAVLSVSIDHPDPHSLDGKTLTTAQRDTLKDELIETIVDIYAAGFSAQHHSCAGAA